MMTSSNGDIFRVASPLCGQFTGHRWIFLTKARDAKLWCFLWSRLNKRLSKQPNRQWFERPLRSLWRHYNESYKEQVIELLVSDHHLDPGFCLAILAALGTTFHAWLECVTLLKLNIGAVYELLVVVVSVYHFTIFRRKQKLTRINRKCPAVI